MKLAMNKETLRDVMKMMTNFSDAGTNEIIMDAMKGGIILTAVDSAHVAMLAVAIGKKRIPRYKVKEPTRILIDYNAADEIYGFCKVCIDGDKDRQKTVTRKNRLAKAKAKKKNENLKEGEKKHQAVLMKSPEIHDITIEFDLKHNQINMHLGQLERSTRLPNQENIPQHNNIDTCTKMYNQLEKIGTLEKEEFEELLNYMRASYSFDSAGYGGAARVVKIIKDDKRFEMETEIETGDEVIIDLNRALKKKTKENMKVMVDSQNLYMAMNRVSKLVDGITLYGNTDMPLLICGTGESPEDAGKFKEGIDFWYLLAPRIEND